jgi:hypothetical protein
MYMSTVPQIPFDMDHEDDAAHTVAEALVRLGVPARAEYMGYGTPVIVTMDDGAFYAFQGWGDEGGWYASRHALHTGLGAWGPDESEESTISIPSLAGITDFEQIAGEIRATLVARNLLK